MARVSKLPRHHCDLPQRKLNILKTFLMKMRESSLMTKTLICRRIIKKQCFLFFLFACFMTISSVTTQHFRNHAKKTKTYKQTNNKNKNKQTNKLPVAYQSAAGRNFSHQKLSHVYYAFASYVRREGHLNNCRRVFSCLSYGTDR